MKKESHIIGDATYLELGSNTGWFLFTVTFTPDIDCPVGYSL